MKNKYQGGLVKKDAFFFLLAFAVFYLFLGNTLSLRANDLKIEKVSFYKKDFKNIKPYSSYDLIDDCDDDTESDYEPITFYRFAIEKDKDFTSCSQTVTHYTSSAGLYFNRPFYILFCNLKLHLLNN